VTTVSYWLANPRGAEFPPAADVRRAGAVIAGGGIAGWSLAYWLREKGIDALVVDPDEMPAGASARNAGFLLAGTSSSYSAAVERWGRALARETESLSWANRDGLLSRIIASHEVEYEPAGSWRLAESEDEEAELRRSLELLHEDGFDSYAWVEREEARRVLGGARFFGGLAQSRDGALHPLRLVAAIARESGQRRMHARVTAFDSTGDDVVVTTDRGEVRTGRLFLATNAYLAQLLGQKARVQPVRAQVLVTEPLDRIVWPRPVYSHYGFFYFRQLPDLRLLLGGARHLHEAEEVGFADITTETLQSSLVDYLESLGMSGLKVDYRWSGVMGFTEDGLPRMHALGGDERIQLLAGFNGHGVGMAFESARRVIERLS
jgi:gamma-glutamylputrescine oxidase